MNADELRRRTKARAVNVITFVESLPRGRSTDFINKIGIVEEEADETLFWIEMLT